MKFKIIGNLATCVSRTVFTPIQTNEEMMKNISNITVMCSMLIAFSLPLSAAAQSITTNIKPAASAVNNLDDLSDGEVKKIDKDNSKITLRHGEIKNLDMPGMTMVFAVKDKPLLDKVHPGDKVKFRAISDNGQLLVTDLQALR